MTPVPSIYDTVNRGTGGKALAKTAIKDPDDPQWAGRTQVSVAARPIAPGSPGPALTPDRVGAGSGGPRRRECDGSRLGADAIARSSGGRKPGRRAGGLRGHSRGPKPGVAFDGGRPAVACPDRRRHAGTGSRCRPPDGRVGTSDERSGEHSRELIACGCEVIRGTARGCRSQLAAIVDASDAGGGTAPAPASASASRICPGSRGSQAERRSATRYIRLSSLIW